MPQSIIRSHSPKLFNLEIEDFNIDPTHVIDFEMKYSIESVMPTGHIILSDAINMESQMFQNGDKKLKLQITDALDQKYELNCIITGGDHSRLGGKNVVLKLDLIEEQSLNLSNLFLGKGYTITTVQNILQEYFDKIRGEKTVNLNSEEGFTPSIIVENFSVPVNKPFTQTIEYFRNKYNLCIFRTKNQFIAKDLNFILSGSLLDKSNDIKYAMRSSSHFYYNKIKDINIVKTNRTKINVTLPNTRTFLSDMKEKEIKTFDYSFSKSLNEISTPGGGQEKANFNSDFYMKTLMRDEAYIINTKSYHFREVQDMKKIEIVVSSNVDLDVGTKVNLDLDQGNGVFGKQALETYYMGNWIIYSITEKLTKGMPMQKIILIKPKY